jgi:predicted O-linked N-acetylglucosamine transferase (SPINDLY family)
LYQDSTNNTEILRSKIKTADDLRITQQWQAALDLYQLVLLEAPHSASLHHNTGLCLFALGDYEAAITSTKTAISRNPKLWQARIICLKALRRLGRIDEVQHFFDELPQTDIPTLEVERASILLHELGDAAAARKLLEALSAPTPESELTLNLAKLYDPGMKNSADVAADFLNFAAGYVSNKTHLQTSIHSDSTKATNPLKVRRQRVGVISPQFRATPVFFFGIGALRLLSKQVDLVFFHRSLKEDWATLEFKQISTEWINTSHIDPIQLAEEIRKHSLDAIIDMGGWMDVPALKALAHKPARRMYKWIGGQAASTGLTAFDGFLGDIAQSPLELQPLYAEPLLLLDSGYVSYTPPSYFPAPTAPDPGIVLGIIANPLKISQTFLTGLRQHCLQWKTEGIEPSIRFIEHRFRHFRLRDRIESAFADVVKIEFVVPDGHLAYLTEVSKLHSVIDTYPYTGGLTTIEALMLGVPCRTKVGQLFCERHTYSHCHFAGMTGQQYLLDGWQPDIGSITKRTSLLTAGSPRLNHQQLATELLEVISGKKKNHR